jgi:hypothetical protein
MTMSDSSALSTSDRLAVSPARAALGDAEAHLRAAQSELCVVVASIAAARGWDGKERTYEATPEERPWHDRIRRVFDLMAELKEAAADVS